MTHNKLPTATQPVKGQRLPGAETWRYAITGFLLGLIFPLISTLVKIAQNQMPFDLPSMLSVQRAEVLLWVIDTAPLFLGALAGFARIRQDVLIETNRKLSMREEEISSANKNLEQLARELENRNSRMGAVFFLTNQTGNTQDLSALISKSVDLIAARLGYYHVSIFLLDEQRRIAFLQASSSEIGRQMLGKSYHVNVGSLNPVGQVAEKGKLYLSPNQNNPEMPRTHSEAAIPLVARGKVIGVLDIQSEQSKAFVQYEVEFLQLLAEQISVSIDNIRLLNQSQGMVNELDALISSQTRLAWRGYLKAQKFAYQYTPAGIRPMGSTAKPENKEGLSIPLILRGQQIGSIALQRKDSQRWSEVDRDLVEKIASQVALALENSRLIEETRRHVSQQQTVSEISAHLSRSLDVDTLLQTAARQLGSLPDVAEVSVYIEPAGKQEPEK